MGLSFAKSKNRIVDLERGTEEPGTRPSKSPPPPQPEILKASGATEQQQQHQTSPCASDHASHIKTEDGAATTIGPSDTGTDPSAPPTSTPYTSKFDTLILPITAVIISERTTTSRGYVALGLGISAGAPERAQTEASIPSFARPLSLGSPVVLVVLLYSTSRRYRR